MSKPNLNTFHLVVFFTFGASLKLWVESGLIGRELLLYKKMLKNGNRVTLITYGGEEDLRYRDFLDGVDIVPVYRYLKKSNNRWINLIKSFSIPFKLRNFLKDKIIIKTNQMRGAWVPLIASILFQKPLVVRCGYEMLRNLLRDEKRISVFAIKAFFGYLLEFFSYFFADRIIISNQSDLRFINKHFLFKKKKMALIRNFIDTSVFTPPAEKPWSRSDNSILYIGRLEDRKNIVNLVNAVSELGCRLDIIGQGSKKELLDEIIKKKAADISFLGTFNNKELPGIIGRYKIYILPSLYENNPKTLLEAMSCARVVIGSNAEGIKELIEDGITGFLCGLTSDEIKSTINKVLKHTAADLEKISARARNFITDHCSIEHIYHLETELYHQLD